MEIARLKMLLLPEKTIPEYNCFAAQMKIEEGYCLEGFIASRRWLFPHE